MRTVLLIAGTRPEAIKVAPIKLAAEARADVRCLLLDSGQHPDLISLALEGFGVEADIRLNLNRETGTLPELASRLFAAFETTFRDHQPDAVMVQGDTLSAGVAAQTAFLMQIPVLHVEAGLRSHDLKNPFPEEATRKIVSQVAARHYCPTDLARQNLLSEGARDQDILVTGNTVVDAVRFLEASLDEVALQDIDGLENFAPEAGAPTILVTCHRRENHGEPLLRIIRAIEQLHEQLPRARFVFPVHPSPQVRLISGQRLGGLERVFLTPPLPYLQLLKLMKMSDVILTDSGGIQEEAPTFGPHLFILREVTERPEVLSYPLAKLVGTNTEVIVEAVLEALRQRASAERSVAYANPFGDGRAAERILDDVERFLPNR
jgi:UDP-N-acetylglucosamine 2-epimerase (non-hydrolysing)